MIPVNKHIAVLHPYVNKVWWAVKMMIYLSNYLDVKNILVFYTFSYDKIAFKDEKISFKIKSFFWKWFFKYLAFFIIAFKIRKSDIIIVWNSPMHFVWVLSKKLFLSKAKIIWWNHHYPWYYGSNTNTFIRLKKYIESSFLKEIDVIVANSKSVKLFIDNAWGINSKILYPMLDNEFFENKNKINNDTKNVIFTYGRRVEWKNIQLIFKTYEALKDKIKNTILIVWWEWNELNKYLKEYKNNPNVKIVWRNLSKEEILANLSKAKIFLFPSLIDSFWIVKIEAMSTWTPIICLGNVKNEEIVKNNINWYCVETEKDFIEKCQLLLTNSKLRQNLSINAISTSKLFSISNFEESLEDIFDF